VEQQLGENVLLFVDEVAAREGEGSKELRWHREGKVHL
jgi:hypothetical protein